MIINTLARSKPGRLALIPAVIAIGAWSWFSYLDGTKNPQDAARVKGWWGWLSPVMEPEWQRLADPKHPDYGNVWHSLKNIGSEWARSDVQRAFKALSFLMVAAIALTFILGVIAL